jgi:hypothetical protein
LTPSWQSERAKDAFRKLDEERKDIEREPALTGALDPEVSVFSNKLKDRAVQMSADVLLLQSRERAGAAAIPKHERPSLQIVPARLRLVVIRDIALKRPW